MISCLSNFNLRQISGLNFTSIRVWKDFLIANSKKLGMVLKKLYWTTSRPRKNNKNIMYFCIRHRKFRSRAISWQLVYHTKFLFWAKFCIFVCFWISKAKRASMTKNVYSKAQKYVEYRKKRNFVNKTAVSRKHVYKTFDGECKSTLYFCYHFHAVKILQCAWNFQR